MTNPYEALESLPVSQKARNHYLLVAACGAALFLAQLSSGSGYASVTLLMVGVLMFVWGKRANVVEVFERHLEIKLAPLAGTRRIRFDDIQGYEEAGNKSLLTFLSKGRTKTLKLPHMLLEPEDRDWLFDEIDGRLAA